MQRMQRGLEGVVDELFTYACPKFVAATPPRLDNLTVNSNQVRPLGLIGTADHTFASYCIKQTLHVQSQKYVWACKTRTCCLAWPWQAL